MPRVVPHGTARVKRRHVPNDLLRVGLYDSMKGAMEKTFGDALVWHMERHNTGVAELSRGSGVSSDVIKKMRTRPHVTTTAENAIAISRYYGKSVTQFMECDESVLVDKLASLIDLLTPEEREQLERQVLGLLQTRSPKPNK